MVTSHSWRFTKLLKSSCVWTKIYSFDPKTKVTLTSDLIISTFRPRSLFEWNIPRIFCVSQTYNDWMTFKAPLSIRTSNNGKVIVSTHYYEHPDFSRVYPSQYRSNTSLTSYPLPSFPLVWSAEGPVPAVGVRPLWRRQSYSSCRSFVQPHKPFSKSQSMLAANNKSFVKWFIF